MKLTKSKLKEIIREGILEEKLDEGASELKTVESMMVNLMKMGRKLKDMNQRKQLAVALGAISDLRNLLK